MPKHGKRYNEAAKAYDRNSYLEIADAIAMVKQNAKAKFDETIELAVKLNLDPRQADQQVRGALVLPHGTGVKRTVLVFAKGAKEKEALDAGADFVGGDELVAKIQGGWFGFDVAVATPDMMGTVGRIGKLLGPKGLMPNPKTGTVSPDIAKAIAEVKAGKVTYRADKEGNMHVVAGQLSFADEKLFENIKAVCNQVIKVKPQACKGVYIKNCVLSSTMGPSIKMNPESN